MPDRGANGWKFEAESAPHRFLPSVRARSAIAAALVVAIALTGGTALLFYLLQRSLINSLEGDLRERIGAIQDEVRTRDPADLGNQLKRTTPQGQLVQLVMGDRVVASSSEQLDVQPLTQLRPIDGQWLPEESGPLKLTDTRRPWVVLTAGSSYAGRPVTVVTANNFVGQQQSLQQVLSLLLFGLPVLVVLVGGGTWVLVGRALRPVEQIRARVAGIGAERLDDRVPMPQTRDEVARLAFTMNEMLDRLDAAQRAQRQFVSDASHELRSPLATLAAGLDVAAADPDGHSWRDLSGLMAAEVARMSALVDNLLLLAKSDDRGLRAADDDVDLDDVLGREVRRLRAAGGPPIAALIRPVRVRGDELQLSQVLRNLIDNAARHTRTAIGVRLEQMGGTAVLIVQDDGPGIPAEHRQRVFERFVRLDESRDRASGGSGLGLAIVAEVVGVHGGRVEIREAPGGGCQVIVQLPAVPTEQVDDVTEVADGVPLALEGGRRKLGDGAQPPSVSSR